MNFQSSQIIINFFVILNDFYKLNNFDLNFIKRQYDDFLKFLNKEYEFDLINAKSFDYVLKCFERDEVEVYFQKGEWQLKFSHPSYSDGFSNALNNKELCERIFCNLMMKLSIKYY